MFQRADGSLQSGTPTQGPSEPTLFLQRESLARQAPACRQSYPLHSQLLRPALVGRGEESAVGTGHVRNLSETYLMVFHFGQIVGADAAADFQAHGYRLSNGKFKKIDFPGATQTFPFAINTLGASVRVYLDSSGNGHGFLRQELNFSTNDFPGAAFTQANGINTPGLIVGDYIDSNGGVHGYQQKGRHFTSIDVPGATATAAFGVNDLGQIVGLYVDRSSVIQGFVTNAESAPASE